MDKLDRLLDDIRIGEVEPQEDLIRTTKRAMRAGQKAMEESSSKKSKMTIRLLAAATLVAFVFVVLIATSIANRSPIDGAAYYTIDINPSFGFTVDEDNVVIDVALLDKDAKELYEGMDCVGLDLEDAIRLIIDKAIALGYMNADGDTYVLLGQFLKGKSGGEGQEIFDDMVERLESKLGDEVKLVGVKGDEEDVKEALELEVSPGLLLLCEMVDDVEPDDDVKVEDVIKSLPDIQFETPVISGSVEGNTLYISWEKVEFSEVEAEGIEVEYKLLKGFSLDEIENKKYIVTKKVADINADQPNSFAVQIKEEDLGKEIYYCLFVRAGHTVKFSNVLPITTQKVESPTPEPEVTPIPIDEVPEQGASEIGASISGDYINIEWSKATEEGFNGYKIMYSSTDSTPVYGEEGCYYLEYVTDINKLSGKYKLSSLKYYKPEKKYYFSITVLYNGQETKVPGNVVAKIMPAASATATATPAPTPDEYPSTNISGERDGNVFYLSWNKITHPDLEGYKVVYSFTDSTPVYGENSYVRWITNASTTSTTVNVSELGEHNEGYVYFSITALYNDHSVKKPGNSVKLTTPGYSSQPYVTPSLTSATYLEEGIQLKWNAVEHSELMYYKANYSFTNSSPAYGAAGTTSYMTYDLSKWADVSGLTAYGPGEICYVSVTAVYSNGKVTSSVKTVTIPEDTTPTYPAANVTSVSDYLVEWSPVSHEHFYSYKVMYTFTDGSGSGEIETLTNMASSLSDFNKETLAGYAPGKTCKFYVKTIYFDGVNDYVVTGSSKAYTFPADIEPTPTPTVVSASANGGTVTWSWNTIEHELFENYVAVYTVNGITYEENMGNTATSCTVTISEYEDGAQCTVKVVAVYAGTDNKTSNSKTVTLYVETY